MTHREHNPSLLSPPSFFCCSFFTNIFLWLQYFSYTSYYSTIKVGAAAVSGCTAHKHTSSSNGTRTRTQHTLVTMVIARDECDCVCIGVFTDWLGSSSGMQRQQRRYWLWWWRRRRRRRRLCDVTSPTANTHARTHMYNFVVVVSILVVHFFFVHWSDIFNFFEIFFCFPSELFLASLYSFPKI